MLLRAHDNRGATSMGQDLSADRAQQHSGEPAMTSITHNQKLSTVRSIDENLSGVALHRSFCHRPRGGTDSFDGISQDLLGDG